MVEIVKATEETEDATLAINARYKFFKKFLKEEFFGGKLDYKLRMMLKPYCEGMLDIFETRRDLVTDLQPIFMETSKFYRKKHAALVEAGLMEEAEAMSLPDLPDVYAKFILDAAEHAHELEVFRKEAYAEHKEWNKTADKIADLKTVDIEKVRAEEKEYLERMKKI